jgi:hypothetical protein
MRNHMSAFLLLSAVFFSTVFAQTINITGKVLNGMRGGLSGTNISISYHNLSTTTGPNGAFSIVYPPTAVGRNQNNPSTVTVYYKNGAFCFSPTNEQKTIFLYDLGGRLLWQKSTLERGQCSFVVPNVSRQLILARIVIGDKEYTMKTLNFRGERQIVFDNKTNPISLRKNLDALDTIKVSCPGYVSAKTPIASYSGYNEITLALYEFCLCKSIGCACLDTNNSYGNQSGPCKTYVNFSSGDVMVPAASVFNCMGVTFLSPSRMTITCAYRDSANPNLLCYQKAYACIRLGPAYSYLRLPSCNSHGDTSVTIPIPQNMTVDSLKIGGNQGDWALSWRITSIAFEQLKAPSITTQPQSQSVTIGQTITFSVVASGEPPLSYQWYKDGTIINGAMSASYTITNVQKVNAGLYYVVVSNGISPNVTSNNAVLSVYGPPDPPTLTLVSTGNGSIIMSWNTVASAASYNIYYTIGSTVIKSAGTLLTATSSPAQLMGLINGKQYAIGVTAVNTAGESPLSNVITAIPQFPIMPYEMCVDQTTGFPCFAGNSYSVSSGTCREIANGASFVSTTGARVFNCVNPDFKAGTTMIVYLDYKASSSTCYNASYLLVVAGITSKTFSIACNTSGSNMFSVPIPAGTTIDQIAFTLFSGDWGSNIKITQIIFQ